MPLDRTEWISLIICLTGLLVALLLIWMIVNQRHYRQIALQPPEPIESKLAEATMTRTAMAIAALLVAGQAIAQDITLDGVARSVSLVNAIYNCGQYYPVDTALLERLDKAFNDVGEQAAAKEGRDWQAILRAEIERRHNEVVATGLQVWCSYQRRIPTNKQFFKRKG
jgi:uncharacterized protein YifE (UPF0438 family)